MAKQKYIIEKGKQYGGWFALETNAHRQGSNYVHKMQCTCGKIAYKTARDIFRHGEASKGCIRCCRTQTHVVSGCSCSGWYVLQANVCTVLHNVMHLCACPRCGAEGLRATHSIRNHGMCAACRDTFYVKENHSTYAHGFAGTRLYHIWHGMQVRCYNQTSPSYERYGGRGIDVDPLWHECPPFIEWSLANGYTDLLTIDRIDNDRGYSPQNCRWATVVEQAYNRRNTIRRMYQGAMMTTAEMAALPICKVSRSNVCDRLRLGWDVHRAITQPLLKRSNING